MPMTLVHDSEFDLAVAHGGAGNGQLKHFYGFDPAGKFQMMTPGSTHVFTVTGGDPGGCTAEFDKPGIVSFLNPPDFTAIVGMGRRGTIPLSGDNVGTTNLILKDKSGKQVDKIEVRVVEAKEIKVRFYNLVDDKGRQGIANPDTSVAFQPAALEQMMSYVNRIVAWQCGVSMSKTGSGAVRNLQFAQDLGNSVDIDKLNIFATSDRDDDAQFHVAFTWGIAGGHSNGITKSNVCLIQTSLAGQKREVTVAHEFVHFLSGSGIVKVNDHDDQNGDLLFKTAPHGIMMRKDRLNKVRRA
jgi:hypothetical protein